MGSKVSRVMATFTRPLRNFNVRERAHREVDGEVPKVAPRHPTTEHVARMQAEAQPPLEEFSRKDDGLLTNLKSVYVTSDEPNSDSKIEKVDKPTEKISRPLPSNRRYVPVNDFGFTEPRYVPEGKISLQNAVSMITEYSADPKNYSVATQSATYKMPMSDVEAIVKNFSAFHVHIPKEDKSKLSRWFIPSWFKEQEQLKIEAQSKTQDDNK